MVKKEFLSWQEIEALVDQLIAKLPQSYDAILAITRGGMVPACLISEKLDIRNVMVAAVMFYTGIHETRNVPIFLQFPADPLLAGKRILIVDDVWDSGATAVAVRERVLDADGIPEVAVIHYKPARSRFDIAPEYYVVATDAWIVYPWDREEFEDE